LFKVYYVCIVVTEQLRSSCIHWLSVNEMKARESYQIMWLLNYTHSHDDADFDYGWFDSPCVHCFKHNKTDYLGRFAKKWKSLHLNLNNTLLLSRNYRSIVTPRKQSLEGQYASLKNFRFPRGNYQTYSFETKNTLLSLLFTTKFSSARLFKNHSELFSTFARWKAWWPNVKSE